MGVILCFGIFFAVIFFTGGKQSTSMIYAILAIAMVVGLYYVAGGQFMHVAFTTH